jgi:hypothetical protein
MILNWTVPLPCYTPELKQPNLQFDYAQELALSTTLNLFWVVWTFNTTRLGSIVRSNCDAGLCSSTSISKLLLCTLNAHHELLAATIHDECLLLLCRVLHWTLPWDACTLVWSCCTQQQDSFWVHKSTTPTFCETCWQWFLKHPLKIIFTTLGHAQIGVRFTKRVIAIKTPNSPLKLLQLKKQTEFHVQLQFKP